MRKVGSDLTWIILGFWDLTKIIVYHIPPLVKSLYSPALGLYRTYWSIGFYSPAIFNV